MSDDGRGLVAGFVAQLQLPGETRSRGEAVARGLLARWSEPHRHYHTVAHLTATLDALRLLRAARPAGDGGELELAAWYHDAVYDGRPGDDEEASARLAEAELGALGLAPARVAEVARLVRVTASHRAAPDDAGGQLLCDADLSVLAGDPDSYRAYTLAVRREYAHVSDADFRLGRARVLTGLADAEWLYASPRARELWEAAARANLAEELTRLTETPPGPGNR